MLADHDAVALEPLGHGEQALTEADILGPSEAFRQPMDYFAHAPQTAATLARLAQLKPSTLACMHGSAWRADGGALLRHLAEAACAPRCPRCARQQLLPCNHSFRGPPGSGL